MKKVVQELIDNLNEGKIDHFREFQLLSDCLRKMSCRGSSSLFRRLHDVEYDDDSYSKLRDALYEAVKRESDPKKKRTYVFIAGWVNGDERVKEDVLVELHLAMHAYTAASNVIHGSILSLEKLGENILPDEFTSRSGDQVRKQIHHIRKYLNDKGYPVPQ